MFLESVAKVLLLVMAAFHEGPDPIAHWEFTGRNVVGNVIKARLGTDGISQTTPRISKDNVGESIVLDGKFDEIVVARNQQAALGILPKQAFTVSAWVAVDQPKATAAILGHVQRDAKVEKGFWIGHQDNHFCFGLASQGSDTNVQPKMTIICSPEPFELERFYHVAAVYDGVTMQLFINGQQAASSAEQSGDIVYNSYSPLSIGAFHDSNELHSLHGRIRELSIYHLAAQETWVRREFERQQAISTAKSTTQSSELAFLVEPFLQFGTETTMTVVWRTSNSSQGKLLWGEDIACQNVIESEVEGEFHTVRIEGLTPETQYFYRVLARSGDQELQSTPSTFQTACRPGTPIAFAVISDTQYQPAVNAKVADMAWARRPHFVIHCGDIVEDGTKEYQWTNEFFASMQPLLSRVAMFPAIGNHEKNAQDYYQYMALPDPEYYYTFSYGDVDFFMIDSNKKVDEGSEQYKWLDLALGQSKATWKIVCHHHPPYSSDENDYGDLWKTNKSVRGDLRIRQLVPLYEKHQVDIVWSGHIHSYERTWPIREGRAVESGGTIYMITGGAGGTLESPGPYRPFFQNNVQRGHHYVMVHIHGRTLELKSYTLEDLLFDVIKIEKQPAAEQP